MAQPQTWNDVIRHPSYIQADPETRKKWRDEWYAEKVIPYAQQTGEDPEQLRKEFYIKSEELDPSISQKDTGWMNEMRLAMNPLAYKPPQVRAVEEGITQGENEYGRQQKAIEELSQGINEYGTPEDAQRIQNIESQEGLQETLTKPLEWKPEATLRDVAAYGLAPFTMGASIPAIAEDGSLGRMMSLIPTGLLPDAAMVGIGTLMRGGATAGNLAKEIASAQTLGATDLANLGWKGMRAATKGVKNIVNAPVKDVIKGIEETGLAYDNAANMIRNTGIDDDVKWVLEKTIADKKEAVNKLYGITAEHTRKKAVEYFVDSAGNNKAILNNLGEEGKWAKSELEAIHGASAKADLEIERANELIGFNGMSRVERDQLDAAIRAKRTIDVTAKRMAEGGEDLAHGGITVDQAQKYWDSMPPAIKEKAARYFDVYKGYLDKSLQEGFISQKTYDDLIRWDYEPRKFLEHIDPEVATFDWRGKPISVHSSGIKSLKNGSEGALFSDSQMLLHDFIARTEGRIARNRANQALALVEDSGIVSNKYVHGYTPVDYFVDGQKRQMFLEPEFAKEWLSYNAQMSQTLGTIMKWLTGAPITKAMATGYNPEFALMNFFRDLGHTATVLGSAGEYGLKIGSKKYPVLPVIFGQQAKDLAVTAKDAFRKTGSYLKYIEEGGGRQTLTRLGRVNLFEKIPGLHRVGKILSYLGETSEIWMRLAARNRIVKNMEAAKGVGMLTAKDYRMATNQVANILDFSQGGSITKAIDQFVPYLNAAVQGTRTVMRAAKKNPFRFTAMAAQWGMAALAFDMWRKDAFPDLKIPETLRERYWIVPTGMTYTDKNGDKNHFVIRIAKDQGQIPITSTFEAISDLVTEGRFNTDALKGALEALSPVGLSNLIPGNLKALITYMANYDLFKKENIWKGGNVPAKEEYTAYTGDVWKKLGESLNMSPERLRASVQQTFTYNNPFTMMSQLADLPENIQNDTIQEIITKLPFARRMTAKINNRQQYRDIIENYEMEAAGKGINKRRKLNEIIKRYNTMPTQAGREAFNDFVRSLETREEKREALKTWKSRSQYRTVEDKSLMLSLMQKSPEVRAKAFHEIMTISDEEKKRSLLSDARKVKGFWTKKTKREYRRLGGR